MKRYLTGLLAFALASSPKIVLAAAAEGGGILNIDPRALVIQICGFVILFLLLKKFLFGPLQNAMATRREEIQTTYTRLEEQQDALGRRQNDLERQIADIEAERRNRIQEGANEGQALREEILQDAQQQATQIIEQGRQMIRMEQEKAIATLREEMADLAVRAAERLIEENLNEDRHRRLVSDFITRVGS
ncbi:MAG: F0F1 ATP synthase subunit B [Armatimonadetes bacterium]|nr:F0F1 ATP synthase subunit B [Armatimonadota bacterium]